ncbi:MAG TPA: hypothetical protein DCP69_01560 [Candidatus Omnitrophica bacterium]|nr:hypothetical protein [Candidatus Omnitrophota bacterium]
MDQFKDYGTAWNSKNAMQYLGRLLASQEMPFQMWAGPMRQQLTMGLMGSGLDQQEAMRTAMLQSAQAMENQARAQGQQFNPMDFQSQAMMDANAGVRNAITQQPYNQLNALNAGTQPFFNFANLGAGGFQQTPKGPGFLGQLAGMTGQILGGPAGAGLFGGGGGMAPGTMAAGQNWGQALGKQGWHW